MPKGGAREGAGRKPGVPNKKTAAIAAAVEASGLTPLGYLLRVMRDEDMDPDARRDAAKAAAPYVHAKLSSVEMSARVSLSHEDALHGLDDLTGEDDPTEAA